MAIIGLEGMLFHGPHGYYPEEEVLGNEFLIDVYVSANTSMAAMQDDLGSTVNYETIHLMIQSEMRKSAQLIETLAERIVSRINDFYDSIDGVKVVVRKLNPPLSGQVRAAYVELKTGSFQSGGSGGGGGSLGGGFGGFPSDLTFR